MRKSILILLAGLMLISAWGSSVHAQWPTDPGLNLTLANGAGEQTTPIIRETSDGGAFILFYSNASGNYDVYLQYVNPEGEVEWENGLLASDNAMTSWVTVWDLEVDVNDNAIFATNDIRDGDDWDMYAYSISTDGTFNWGEDGVTLTSNELGDVGQQSVGTSDGGAVFAWQDDNSAVNLTKLDADGNSAWDPAVITITAEFPVDRIKLAKTDDGGVIVGYQEHTSSFWMSPSYYVGQRYDADGAPQWGEGGVQANPSGDISAFTQPDIVSDGANGALFYWYNNNNHTFAQHVDANGNVLWNDGSPVQASLADDRLQTSPDLAYDAENGVTYLFYGISNSNQSLWGVGGQAISTDGTRLWGDNAVELVALGQPQASHVSANYVPGYGAVASYLINAGGTDDRLEAIMVDNSGAAVWETSPAVLSTVISDKGYHNAVVTTNGQVLSVFTDDRNGTPDLFLQNVNPDGSFGAWGGNNPEPTIEITAPENDAVIEGPATITVTYDVTDFDIDDEGGDGELKVTLTTTEGTTDSYLTDDDDIVYDALPYGEVTVILELVDYEHASLDPVVADTVTFTYNSPPPPPELTITSPANDDEVTVPEVEVSFTVANFVLGTDGSLAASVNSGDVSYYDSADPITLTGLTEGTNTILLELVDSEHNSLDPAVTASVSVTYLVNAVGEGSATPSEYALAQAYPNPFNPSTNIRFAMKETGSVRIAVYDMLGREVAVLTSGVREAGVHTLSWQAMSQPSGVYFLRMTTGSGFSATEKLVRMK